MFQVAALISGFLLAQSYRLPDAAQANLDRLIESIGDNYSPFDMKRRDEITQRFVRLFDELGERLDPALRDEIGPLEGHDIQSKLVVLAIDRKQRPALYREIEREYLENVDNPRARFPQSRQLQAEHKTEMYRLPWEYILLRPTMGTDAAFHDGNARNALAAIGNGASILSLAYSCRMASKGEQRLNPKIEDRERLVLGGLGAFVNQQGLKAILQCLEWTEAQWQDERRWQPVSYAAALLKKTDWQRVIGGLSRANLTDKQRQLMERLK